MIARAIDLILVLIVLEGIALSVFYRRFEQGIHPRRLIANLAAGFFLMLAVRLASASEGDGPVAACLFAALIAHLLDLAAGWQRRD